MKKITKLLVLGFVVSTMAFPLVALGSKETDSKFPGQKQSIEAKDLKVLHVSVLNGPSGVGMAYMFDNHPDLKGVKSTFEVTATPDVLLPRMIKGEIDIGVLPPNVAAKVYNSNGSLIMGGICGEGNLFLLTRDKTVHTFADLPGKTIYVAGQSGSTPDYVCKYLANKALLEIGEGADQVNIDFSIPTVELAPSIISGKIDYIIVPEPFATVCQMKDQTLLRAINLQEAWMAYSDDASNYPITVVVIRKEIAQNYPETVKLFLAAYEKSILWTNTNPVEAGNLVEKYTLGISAPIATKAIPSSAFTFIPAQDAKNEVEKLLSLFVEIEPTSIGGKLPDDGFYF
ncbi:MAG: hypothetical protein BKP49_09510 [Treponema sp. CETP13]|nr:MAG: hypothetical protein BKP49_09510 [Treponema sp. CETP13]